MMLTDLKKGEKARILDLAKGTEARRRLVDMGIIPGTEIEVIARHPFGGPMLLKVGSSHVALGRGISQGIEVERIKGISGDY